MDKAFGGFVFELVEITLQNIFTPTTIQIDIGLHPGFV